MVVLAPRLPYVCRAKAHTASAKRAKDYRRWISKERQGGDEGGFHSFLAAESRLINFSRKRINIF
jgi:hypothetical protein